MEKPETCFCNTDDSDSNKKTLQCVYHTFQKLVFDRHRSVIEEDLAWVTPICVTWVNITPVLVHWIVWKDTVSDMTC